MVCDRNGSHRTPIIIAKVRSKISRVNYKRLFSTNLKETEALILYYLVTILKETRFSLSFPILLLLSIFTGIIMHSEENYTFVLEICYLYYIALFSYLSSLSSFSSSPSPPVSLLLEDDGFVV